MTASHEQGPSVTYGIAAGAVATNTNPEAGPSISYQGGAILDVRFPYAPGMTGVGKVSAWLDTPYVLQYDAVPAALDASCIAAAANPASGTAMTLVTSQTAAKGIVVNCPIVPQGSGFTTANLVSGNILGIDIGMIYGDTTSTSKNIAISSLKVAGGTAFAASQFQFYVGQKLWISSGAGSNKGLFTYVTSITATNIVLNDAAGASVTRAAIATLDPTGTALLPWLVAGHGLFFDPTQGLGRCIKATGGNASAAGGNIDIVGYDVFGVLTSERLVLGAGAVTATTKKAFKYIKSVTPQYTDSFTVSIGTSDTYSLNIRSDKWEYLNIYWAGSYVSANTGWTGADTTNPSVGSGATSTGDVRGTYTVQTSASDGARRLAVFMSLPLSNLTQATPSATSPLYGITQA